MDYILPKPYLSSSQIKTLFKCPKQYEYRYIKNIKGTNLDILKGSSVHKTLEMVYSDKKHNQPSITSKQASELTVYNLDTFVKEAQESEELPKIDIDKDKLYADVIPVTMDYVEHITPYIIPIDTEVEFVYTSRCGVEMLMYIDLVKQTLEEDPNSRSLVDYKVSSKRWSINQLQSDFQFMLYTKAVEIPTIEIHNLIKGEKRSTKHRTYSAVYKDELEVSSNLKCLQTQYPQQEHDHIEDIIELAAKVITAGVFMPTDPSNWVCSKKWCGYWDMCRGKK